MSHPQHTERPADRAAAEPAAEPNDQPGLATTEQDADESPDTAPEHAWDSRRDLLRHTPGFFLGPSARFGGSMVAGDQHGVSGGQVFGDVILGGSKIEYRFGEDSEERSGEIPSTEVEAMAARFIRPASEPADATVEPEQDAFGAALRHLTEHRVVILSGSAETGRRTAALMLLRAAGTTKYRALDPSLPPGRLAGELRAGWGHVLPDYTADAERPLREHHVRALSERLHADDGHLVVVVGPHPSVHGSFPPVPWQPPAPTVFIRGRLLRKEIGADEIERLLALEPVRAMTEHPRPMAELAWFSGQLADFSQGRITLEQLSALGHHAAEQQVRTWFDGDECSIHDKAFLVSLAAFDDAPYPLAAELGDVLFTLLQKIENPHHPAGIPVFGTSSARRIDLARADRYQEPEETEWGPVLQTKIQFRDRLTAPALLREVWNGHPSARPALVSWLRSMAQDPRPLVRTRAAFVSAVLAQTDLASTMALLIQPWAAGRQFRARLAAANALALTQHLGTPHISRILHDWCTSENHQLRRTSVRGYALIGDSFPEQAIAALIEAVHALDRRGGPPAEQGEELDEIAQSAAAVLLAVGQRPAQENGLPGATALWTDLVPLARTGLLRGFVLRTVVHACGPTDSSRGTGRPLLLDLFAQADPAPGTPGALLRQSLAALWRTLLNDPSYSGAGLNVMRQWATATAADPDAEAALAELLQMLAVSTEDVKRLDYLLEHLPRTTGAPPFDAARLRSALLRPTPPQSA
ncbi:hypothetical protein OU787_14190 [Kitasatospora sp. YST-16]|uniref:hypothetical protein n=1 Tax=Kitasatospora sp. YST-16 TaxID=2998080 RepID=UPI002283A15D|nr:hypothetical protein [Kitasatospora sp. YST-16]WAL72556.1 hypothetical protein OU787_14190 [Kitasatospora sp. YST-16]WNW38603.1 hypothetical protein RKE32_14135 [Streptomyces sp. Li-HN-5-13]